MSSKIYIPSSNKLCYWPHFAHAMEYFYFVSCNIYTNSSPRIIGKHNQPYVQSFINVLKKINSKIFIDGSAQEIINDRRVKKINPSLSTENTLCAEGLVTMPKWFSSANSSQRVTGDILKIKGINRTEEKLSIGIINRSGGPKKRQLINSDELINSIQTELNTIVNEATFDGASFYEQIKFCAGHNIIISPHGAQVISIPFMPTRGLFIEIFNKDYYIPEYYGNLAIASGKRYVHLHNNCDESPFNKWKMGEPPYWIEKRHKNARSLARSQPIYANTEEVVLQIKKYLLEN